MATSSSSTRYFLTDPHKVGLDYSSSSEVRLPTGHIARVGIDVEMVFHDNGIPLIPAGGALVYVGTKVLAGYKCATTGMACELVTSAG